VDLIDPGLLDIRFIALFQTVDQRGHQASALADRKLHRLLEQLFRFICHAPSMPDLVGCCYRRFSGDQARLERNHSWSGYRHTATSKRQRLRDKNRRRRDLLAALPVSSRNRKRLLKQLALRQAIESRALKRKLANQRKAIRKSPHPGTWRRFVARCAAHGDARAIRLLRRREREQGRSSEEREL
jgi:hypothetical protein